MVHSGGLSSRQWRRLGAELSADFEVLAPDLLGYGTAGAWPPGRPFHFHEDLALLEGLLEAGPAHVVGHSYGGLLALQLALSRPDAVRSLALYEPVAFGILQPGPGATDEDAAALEALQRVPMRYAPDADGVDEAWLRGFVDWWNGAGAWDTMAPEVRASFRAVGWKLSQEVTTLVADRTDAARYAQVQVPTLLLGGGRTPATERRVLARLAAALPHATLQLFPELGHMGPVTHAAQVNAAIAAHLRHCAALP
nr:MULTISPECIES: alpha/beta hydrolase [Myxococcaceae]